MKKKEQLSLVLRYSYNGAVHESFLDFQQATRLDAEGLKDKSSIVWRDMDLSTDPILLDKVTMEHLL